MLHTLLIVSPRNNDTLTLGRGRALAMVMLMFIAIVGALGCLDVIMGDLPALLNSVIGLGLFGLVYAINRSGHVRAAVSLLLVGGVLVTTNGAVVVGSPVPTVYFLGLTIVVAAAFGPPHTPLLWATALTGLPFVINMLLYDSPVAPAALIPLPDGATMPSLFAQELFAIALFWMLAGTAYLASRLLHQMLDESRAATAQVTTANQALRLSEERFSKVFHASPIAIGISTFAEGRFIDLNDSFLDLTGYRRDEAVGHTGMELGLWGTPADRVAALQTLRTQGWIRDLESRFRTKSGDRREALAFLELIDLEGEACILSMLHDITTRKQTEAALRESEERYRLITENTSDLIAMFDQQGRYAYASPSHYDLLGINPADLIGISGTARVHPDDMEIMRGQWEKLRTEGTALATLRYRHADGSWRWLEASATRTGQQGVGYFISVARDVTERKRLEAQFLQAQKMEGIGRLAGGIAHDFNNLLTAITGYAEMARDSLPPADPAYADLAELLKASDRATSLTRQLLAFARKQIIEPRVLNLNDLILDMDRLLRRLIGEDIELVTLPAADLDWVKVDPGQIEQVIVNLAINARDAMPDGGKLTIETQNTMLDDAYARQHMGATSGSYVLLAVSDTGVGMDAETQAHLFEPFFTTKEPGKGTGLGLATCYGITKQHGGYIGVYSETGQGTTVNVYLRRVEEAPAPRPAHDATDGLPRGTETVLLVEDEAAVRELAARILRVQGYTVWEAANGDEAIALVRNHTGEPIDLLLTDVVMPQIGGKALAEWIVARYSGVKVLFMSGYADDAIVHHGRLDPGIAFLQKPFSSAALTRKVREVLDA
jgi:two-component system cell cycle sensor histidine kinase/response regulator CckA